MRDHRVLSCLLAAAMALIGGCDVTSVSGLTSPHKCTGEFGLPAPCIVLSMSGGWTALAGDTVRVTTWSETGAVPIWEISGEALRAVAGQATASTTFRAVAVRRGSAVIVARSGADSASGLWKVVDSVQVNRVDVMAHRATVRIGESVPVYADLYAMGGIVSGRATSWMSSDTTIATVTWGRRVVGSSHDSVPFVDVRGRAVGTVVITGAFLDVRDTLTFSVAPCTGIVSQCDPFGIRSTSRWTGAAITARSSRTRNCIAAPPRASPRPMHCSLAEWSTR